jgi:nucleotide-binding universal stress UspA family protein
MYRFNKMLVNLALDDQDEALLTYAVNVAGLSQPEKIYVVHLSKNLDLPEEVRREYPSILEPTDEYIVGDMEEKVKAILKVPDKTTIDINAIEGNPLDELLRLIVQKDIDLVITGRRPEVKESGTLAEKLTRKAPCSVLTITCCTLGGFNDILLPVDFSEHSMYAVDVATAWAKASGAKSIDIVNVYKVPIGYYKTGKSYEQFAEIMKNNTRKEYDKFIQDIDLRGITPTPNFILNENVSKGVLEAVEKHSADLVIMASRGRSDGVASLLGTTTERVLSQTDTPLLAVKQKGSGIGFLRLILEI